MTTAVKIEQIYHLLSENQGVKISKLAPNSDLRVDLGIDGDDFSEFIMLFAEKFGVDMQTYLWYFHHAEEGWNLGAWFFKPPYLQVETIPVTPKILLEAARLQRWPICYPEHQLTKGRPDIALNWVLLFSPIAVVSGIWLLNKLSS